MNEFFKPPGVLGGLRPPKRRFCGPHWIFETNLKDLDLYAAHLKHPSGRRWALAFAYSRAWAVKDPTLLYASMVVGPFS